MTKMYANRTSWVDFPPVLVMYPLKTLSNFDEKLYIGAKSGDELCAVELLTNLLNSNALQRIKACLKNKHPILAPVLAIEAMGNNRLPLVFAQLIASKLLLPITVEIVQAVKANHTNAGAYERIVRQPIFTGKVEKGKTYVIIDDTVAMGGTLAGLKGYIESQGGKVIQAIVMTGYSVPYFDIVPTEKMLNAITAKHPQLSQWWLNEFKFPLENLTQGELGHLKSPSSLDEIRNRLAQAGL